MRDIFGNSHLMFSLVESMSSWRKRATDDYQLWKTELWDPASDEQHELLRAGLWPEVDGDLLRQSGAWHMRSVSKQFSGLVRSDDLIIWSQLISISLTGPSIQQSGGYRDCRSRSVYRH